MQGVVKITAPAACPLEGAKKVYRISLYTYPNMSFIDQTKKRKSTFPKMVSRLSKNGDSGRQNGTKRKSISALKSAAFAEILTESHFLLLSEGSRRIIIDNVRQLYYNRLCRAPPSERG